MNDIVVNKTVSIQRCVRRAREEYAAAQRFVEDFTRQDAAILNITRACEQAIDLANHVIRTAKLGVPEDSGQTFGLLADAGVIDHDLAVKLKKMVGFRNVAVHEYQDLDITVVETVINYGLDNLLGFTDRIIEWGQADRGAE
jgi:uncharacterized protein YutE (UPF0331/DUF86 family)